MIELIAESDWGCLDTADHTIEVKDPLIFYVPNAFTPDGDQYNNTFQPVFTSGYAPQSYTLLIFNRWGEVIFESRDPNIGWSGHYNGKIVKDGTYIWRIVFSESETGNTIEKTGHVTLIR